MNDDFGTPQQAAPARRGGTWRAVLATALLAFVIGIGLAGWIGWKQGADFGLGLKADSAVTQPQLPQPTAALPVLSDPASQLTALALENRIAGLEDKLTRLDLQAQAAAGNAARAEGLLVAFAARRALDRGVPLGTLEDQLRLRFADAQPNAVKTVIDAAHAPVTLDQLVSQIKAMQDKLTATPAGESGWQRVRREITGLFVIRHDDAAAVPADRIDHAALLLREGRVDDAIAEIARLPGAGAAAGWIAAAKRYADAQQALDLIESTALLDPHTLHGADGRRIDQPSPLAAPTPEAAAP